MLGSFQPAFKNQRFPWGSTPVKGALLLLWPSRLLQLPLLLQRLQQVQYISKGRGRMPRLLNLIRPLVNAFFGLQLNSGIVPQAITPDDRFYFCIQCGIFIPS